MTQRRGDGERAEERREGRRGEEGDEEEGEGGRGKKKQNLHPGGEEKTLKSITVASDKEVRRGTTMQRPIKKPAR